MRYLIMGAIIPCLLLLGSKMPAISAVKSDRWERCMLWFALLMLLAIFFMRWNVTLRPPLHGLFDTLIIFAWCIVAATILLGLLSYDIKKASAPAAGIVTLLLLYSLTHAESTPDRLPPALQSPWFVPHVLLYFCGYALLAISAGAALAHLFSRIGAKAARAAGDEGAGLEALVRATLLAGFLFVTLGLLTGAIWAKYAWGSYWGWDPKEAWALITWLLYLGVLHPLLRRSVVTKGLLLANVGVFLIVLFTYFGVKFLPTAMSSIHVY